jgi:transposase
VKNAHEALQRVLARHNASLRTAASLVNRPATAPDAGNNEAVDRTTVPSPQSAASNPAPVAGHASRGAADSLGAPGREQVPKEQQLSQQRRARRLARYQEVQELRRQGVSIRQIARQLGMHVTTVRRFLAAQFPERAARPARPSKLAPHIPYLPEQLLAGRDNGVQLWRELRDHHGLRGSRALVSRWVAAHRALCPPKSALSSAARRKGRPPHPQPPNLAPRYRTPSARTAMWLLVTNPSSLDSDDAAFVAHLLALSPEVATGQELSRAFRRILQEHDVPAVDAWFARTETCGIPEFVAFAAGLRRDEAAFRAAVALPYNSGQVEGQIARLKLLKRSMYGRASFDLLKRRLLAA